MSRRLKLPKRLKFLLNLAPECGVLADIGSDHGLLPASALLSGKCEYAIAADISAPSLAKAKNLAQELGVDDRMDFRVGDGATVLNADEAEVIVIACIGANLICSILDAGRDVIGDANLILSPNIYPERLRDYLINNGFGIERDDVIYDGKYYTAISARRGESEPYSERELLLGKYAEPTEGQAEYLRYKIALAERNLAAVRRGGGDDRGILAELKLLKDE